MADLENDLGAEAQEELNLEDFNDCGIGGGLLGAADGGATAGQAAFGGFFDEESCDAQDEDSAVEEQCSALIDDNQTQGTTKVRGSGAAILEEDDADSRAKTSFDHSEPKIKVGDLEPSPDECDKQRDSMSSAIGGHSESYLSTALAKQEEIDVESRVQSTA